MDFVFDMRPSDSPLVSTIWHTHSVGGGSFISSAVSNWEMVVTKYQGKIDLAIRGPETQASIAPIPEDAEFFGIQFKLGTYMPNLPTIQRVNSGIILPEAESRTFWLDGSAWQFPTFDNADTFVERLVREGLLAREPIVDAVLHGHINSLSLRSIQRRFLRATGLTHGEVFQIERAKRAVALLEQGVSILDTVDAAGYADQPHMTRALRRFMGHTPAQILRVTERMAAAS